MKSLTNRIYFTHLSTYISSGFVLLLLLLSFTNVYADGRTNWMPAYYNSPVRIDVIDDSGHYLKQYPANSRAHNTQRAYLEAVKGRRYKIRIRNNSGRRIGVVIAVDGRNILNGKKSYLRSNEKMYVLDPYETSSYMGWRTGKNRVNRFYFTSAGDSYSNAWGDRSAMGVIAVAVFNERPQYYRRKQRNDFNKMAPSARRSYSESAGTGFGREEYSPSVRVNFVAQRNPAYKYFYKYEWRSTLCKRRIIKCYQYESHRRNKNRFWPDDDNDYAPYPPNYPRYRSWDEFDSNR